MIRPLMLLVLHIQPHNPPIGILTAHNPPFDARKDATVAHTVLFEPPAPFLQVAACAHAPGDGIPAALRGGLLWIVARLDDQVRRLVYEHLRKEFVLWGEVVVMRRVGEGENCRVEDECALERGNGEFEVVDAPERRWDHRRGGC